VEANPIVDALSAVVSRLPESLPGTAGKAKPMPHRCELC